MNLNELVKIHMSSQNLYKCKNTLSTDCEKVEGCGLRDRRSVIGVRDLRELLEVR